MKKLLMLLFSLLMLTACTPSDKDSVTAGSDPLEEEKIAEMIRLIEAEEARMEASGEI